MIRPPPGWSWLCSGAPWCRPCCSPPSSGPASATEQISAPCGSSVWLSCLRKMEMMVSSSPPHSHLSSLTPSPKDYRGKRGLPWEKDLMALGVVLWVARWDSCYSLESATMRKFILEKALPLTCCLRTHWHPGKISATSFTVDTRVETMRTAAKPQQK